MLLTKPLTQFLAANRTPQLHTLMLLTPSGKILAFSSSHPTSILREQATLASSLWALYSPLVTEGTLHAALPDQPQQEGAEGGDEDTHDEPSSISVQLEQGTIVVRMLACALLFLAIGPASAAGLSSSTSTQSLTRDLSHLAINAASSSASSPRGSFSNAEERRQDSDRRTHREMHGNGVMSSGASDAGSTTTVRGLSLRALKRRSDELASWLDAELGGFSLGQAL